MGLSMKRLISEKKNGPVIKYKQHALLEPSEKTKSCRRPGSADLSSSR